MNHWKAIVEGGSIGTIVASLIGWLPPVAALVAIAWNGYQFYDLYRRRKQEKNERSNPPEA